MSHKKGKKKKNYNKKQRKKNKAAQKKRNTAVVTTPNGKKIVIPIDVADIPTSVIQAHSEDVYKPILTSLIVDLWSFRRKLEGFEDKLPEDISRSLKRPIESAFQKMKQAEIEVIDNVGEKHHIGSDVRVIAYEETPGIKFEIIKETIKPTITYRRKHIFIGEVIVGEPISKEDKNELDEAEEK